MSTSPADFNAQIIEEFRANEGRVGGMFEGNPLLLLHHTGARSGKSYINPLAYQADGGRYVIFASKGGAPEQPRLVPQPQGQPGDDDRGRHRDVAVVAEEAAGEERDRLYATQAERIAAVRRLREAGRADHPGDRADAAMSAREHDIVLFGATSFVGRLTADVPAQRRPGGGADRARRSLRASGCEALRDSLGAERWPLLVADTRDPTLAARARGEHAVLASTVGPYRRYGIPVVRGLRRGRHPLRRPHGRDGLHAGVDRRASTRRARERRAHRPHLRLRLDPLGHRRSRCCTNGRRQTVRVRSATRRWSCARSAAASAAGPSPRCGG